MCSSRYMFPHTCVHAHLLSLSLSLYRIPQLSSVLLIDHILFHCSYKRICEYCIYVRVCVCVCVCACACVCVCVRACVRVWRVVIAMWSCRRNDNTTCRQRQQHTVTSQLQQSRDRQRLAHHSWPLINTVYRDVTVCKWHIMSSAINSRYVSNWVRRDSITAPKSQKRYNYNKSSTKSLGKSRIATSRGRKWTRPLRMLTVQCQLRTSPITQDAGTTHP